MTLRDYQIDVVHRTYSALHRTRRALIVVPTGGGKTVIGAEIAGAAVQRGRRVLWLAHRRELVKQAATRLGGGLILAGHKQTPGELVQVASIDTLFASGRVPDADVIIVDEAHHAPANRFRSLLGSKPNSWVVGLTATPERSDGAAMGDVFDELVAGPSVAELVERGHLVGCDVIAPASEGSGLAMDPVDAWLAYSKGRPGFVFAATVDQSKEIAADLVRAGIKAAHVDGKTPKGVRDSVVGGFRAGRVDVLSSVGVFTEGTDLPRATVCLLARGCSHAGAYLQMVGRVLRPSAGKDRSLVVDLKGAVHKHGLPEDPREYSLEGRAIRSLEALPSLAQCLECGAVWRRRPSEIECPRCGAELPKPKAPEVKPRALDYVQPSRPGASVDSKRARLAALRGIAQSKGYKRTWPAIRFRAEFGHWPAKGW